MVEAPSGVWTATPSSTTKLFFDLEADPFENTNKLAALQTLTTEQAQAYGLCVSAYSSLQTSY
jgi:hypothetical protein